MKSDSKCYNFLNDSITWHSGKAKMIGTEHSSVDTRGQGQEEGTDFLGWWTCGMSELGLGLCEYTRLSDSLKFMLKKGEFNGMKMILQYIINKSHLTRLPRCQPPIVWEALGSTTSFEPTLPTWCSTYPINLPCSASSSRALRGWVAEIGFPKPRGQCGWSPYASVSGPHTPTGRSAPTGRGSFWPRSCWAMVGGA